MNPNRIGNVLALHTGTLPISVIKIHLHFIVSNLDYSQMHGCCCHMQEGSADDTRRYRCYDTAFKIDEIGFETKL